MYVCVNTYNFVRERKGARERERERRVIEREREREREKEQESECDTGGKVRDRVDDASRGLGLFG